jgi:glutathione S-transferase
MCRIENQTREDRMAGALRYEPLKLLGAPGSPYTRKMLALLRYRRIPYAVLWGSHQDPTRGLPEPRVKLLPTFYFPDGTGGFDAVVDSTPILRRLEAEHSHRSVIPEDPVLAFFAFLVEDYADEWLTKCMFHYRWAHPTDAANAGPLLIFWSQPTLPDDQARRWSAGFAKRQIDRLFVVGSNATTAPTIEASYLRALGVLDGLLQRHGYVLGARPCSADFAIYGQLTQLAIIEPTSAALAAHRAPRVRAWIDRMEDLSGVEPDASDWIGRAELRISGGPLLAEIGRVYVPFLLANAQAVRKGAPSFDARIDGRPWTQPTFPYQAKCLQEIRGEFAALSDGDRAAVRDIAAGTGCDAIFC